MTHAPELRLRAGDDPLLRAKLVELARRLAALDPEAAPLLAGAPSR